MAQFDTPQVTRAGAALMAKALAGSGKIEFTFLTIGDAEYTDEQKTDAALQERTALKNQRMSFPFSSVTVKDETNVCLKAVVSNEKVTESFYITEMGLWARDASDETSTPILYSIITASVGDYLPVYNGSVPSTIEEIWYTTVSNKATITISANATAYALAEDVGNVRDLTTDDKSSAVAAINEINAYATLMNAELLQQTNALRKGRNLLEVFGSEIAKYDDEMQWIKDRLDMKYVKGLMIRDYIPITCTDGEEFEEQIAGINSYCNTTDQPVPYHIDFISRDCAKDTVQWNTTNNNNGTADQKNPFIASNLRKYLNETLYAKLPDKVKRVITEKRMLVEDRYSAGGALTDSTGWHWDSIGKCWVPTEVETFGQVVWGTKGWSEGQAIRYPVFETYADILKGQGKGGSRYRWWLLSAHSGGSAHACGVDYYGYAGYWSASYSACVPLCFRVTA